MPKARDLESAALDDAQRKVLECLARSELATQVVLTGGTALSAFFLQHRTSEDVDLFSDDDVPLTAANEFLRNVPGLRIDAYERRYDRKLFTTIVNNTALKIEFTKFPYPRAYGKVKVGNSLWVDSPNEILVNKLLAMTDRREPKDFVDVFLLLRSEGAPTLVEAIQMAEKKFGVQGLRYTLQSQMLAVPQALPATTPRLDRAEVVAEYREHVKALVAAFAAG